APAPRTPAFGTWGRNGPARRSGETARRAGGRGCAPRARRARAGAPRRARGNPAWSRGGGASWSCRTHRRRSRRRGACSSPSRSPPRPPHRAGAALDRPSGEGHEAGRRLDDARVLLVVIVAPEDAARLELGPPGLEI